MKKFKLYSLLIVMVAFIILITVGCNEASSGDIKVKSVDSRTITISYSFDNSYTGGLFLEDELKINFGYGSGSGLYTQTGLQSDTEYTFCLKDIGDPVQTVLDSKTIKTLVDK